MARVRRKPIKRLQEAEAVPAALGLGRCIEVWAASSSSAYGPQITAWSRWDRAARWWLAANEITDTKDQVKLLPPAPPWSYAHLMTTGRSEEAGERLRRHGLGPDDLPALKKQADELLKAATNERSLP